MAIAIPAVHIGVKLDWSGVGAAIAATFECAARKSARQENAGRAAIRRKAQE